MSIADDLPWPDEIAYMQAAADAALERKIDGAKLRALGSKTPAARRVAWEELRELIGRRSPQQVARMERRMGLAR